MRYRLSAAAVSPQPALDSRRTRTDHHGLLRPERRLDGATHRLAAVFLVFGIGALLVSTVALYGWLNRGGYVQR
jgi:hypothetical protein